MRILFLLAITVVLAACAYPDPFGVDCRTSPACQEREAAKQRAAQADKKKACEAEGQVYLSHDDYQARKFDADLQCDGTTSACSGPDGCGLYGSCVGGKYCLYEGSGWEGHCLGCADRADLEADEAAFLVRYKAGREGDRRADAEGEIASGKCYERNLNSADATLSDVERATGATSVSRGNVVATSAGVKLTIVVPDLTRRYQVVLTAQRPFTVRGAVPVASTAQRDGDHELARAVIDPRQDWTIGGDGCVAWTVFPQ